MHITKKFFVRYLSVTILSVFLFLLVGELGIRVYLKYHTVYAVEMTRYATEAKVDSHDPLIQHVHKPNTTLPLMNVPVHINSDGFRDNECPVIRDYAKTRIIFLGDSLTMGWGVEQEDTFERLLEKKLSKEKPTEIINFGTGNYNTEQEVNLFLQKGLKYKPDLVVVFYFINDAEPTLPKSKWSFWGHSRIITFYWSRISALISNGPFSRKYTDYYASLYRGEQKGWMNSKKAFLQLNNACKKHAIGLKVVLLPEFHNLADYPFEKEHELVMYFLRENNIEALDLAPYFSSCKDARSLWVAKDDAHPNKLGHRLIAGYAYEFIRGKGEAK